MMPAFDRTPSEPRRGWLRHGNPPGDFSKAPRCGAKTRRGTACQCPAMKNGRCRLHGGLSTGPKTPEGIERIRRAAMKHGRYSQAAKAERRHLSQLLKDCRAVLEDINGDLQSEKVRYAPKDFRWRSPSPDGGWCRSKADAVTVYRLPHLIDVRLVLLVESEKSVERLRRLGFVATCPPSGASVWSEAFTEVVWRAGAREVVVIPDNDNSGRKHAKRVVEACHGFRANFGEFSIEPEEPWAGWPSAEPDDDEVEPLRAKLLELEDLPHRGDVCDWLDARHTAEELCARVVRNSFGPEPASLRDGVLDE